jgi:MFS family permease
LAAAAGLSELWQFYLCFGVVFALGVSLAGSVPAVIVLSRWFSNRRGMAIGLASAGQGLGMAIIIPLSQYLIAGLGWRSAYSIMAGVALLGIVPQSALLLVGHPKELGLKPDGASVTSGPFGAGESAESPAIDREQPSRARSVATVIRMSSFWLLTACFVMTPLSDQMLFVHDVAYLVDGGYDKMLAAAVAGVTGLVSIPGRILWGMTGDRVGREIAYTIGIGIMVLAILLLVLAGFFPSSWLVLLFAITFGIGFASAAVIPSAAADLFEARDFGVVYGLLNVSIGVGAALGAWSGGYIFDATGSYLLAFAIAALSATAGVGSMWLAAPRKIRRKVCRQT